MITDGYSSFAINTTFRGGKPTNRPAYHQLVIPEQEHKWNFEYTKHQGEFVYQDLTTDFGYLIAVRGGSIFKVTIPDCTITLLNPTDGNDKTRRHYFCQADKFLIIQNGVDVPFIWDGTVLRRSYAQSNNPGVENVSIINNSGTATVTTTDPHGFAPNDFVAIDGAIAPAAWVGNYRILTVPTDTTYTIKAPNSTTTNSSPSGTSYRPMEVPIGLFMEYTMGRLCVVMPDRKTMKVGDLIRSTPDNTFSADSVLWFTEDLYLAENYTFSLPASQGRIRALKSIPFNDAPTGQGDLLISGDKGISTLNLALPRTQWKTSPIQKIALTGVAVAGQGAMEGYNGDILFRDLEYGVRTFRITQANSGKTPAQTPISSEMIRIFGQDEQDKLQFTSMAVFDNRLLTTVTPVYDFRYIPVLGIAKSENEVTITFSENVNFVQGDTFKVENTTLQDATDYTVAEVISPTSVKITTPDGAQQDAGGFIYSPKTGAEYYHKGIAPLDYTTLSGAGGTASVAWEGLWTGVNTQTIHKAFIQGAPTCILATYNTELRRNELWKITTSPGPDVGELNSQYPDCMFETPALHCTKPFSEKKLLGLNFFLIGLAGNVGIGIRFRNDGDECWGDWELSTADGELNFELCATSASEIIPETSSAVAGLSQAQKQRRYIRLGSPSEPKCEVTTTADWRNFFETQLQFRWKGNVVWDKIELMALESIQDMRGGCR